MNKRMYFTVQYANKRNVSALSHNVIKTKQTEISLTPCCEHPVPIISTFLFCEVFIESESLRVRVD